MNKQLLELYEANWKDLCEAFKPIILNKEFVVKPTNPLLIDFSNAQEFVSADIRVMIYGQETNNWFGEFNSDIPITLNNYDTFINKGECWSYGGQFWNGVARFITKIKEKYPEKKIEIVSNNIVKIGKLNEKGFPPKYIYEIERSHFNVIPEELKIIKPNVVIFFTGPNYDSVITDNFGKLEFETVSGFSSRWLSKVNLTDVEFAFRTYHPNYLWRNNIDKTFNAIIEEIKFQQNI